MAIRKGLKKVKVKVSGYTATRYKKKASTKKATPKRKVKAKKGTQTRLF